MPNPLIGGRLVTSKNNVDRPTAIEPVPEHYAGDNNPYRGIENHGVASDNAWRETSEDLPEHDGREVPVYESEDDTPNPIPVVVVNRGSRERRAFRSVVAYAGGSNTGRARMLIGQDESRTSVTIQNKSIGIDLWISDSPETANAQSGWFIGQDTSYRSETQGAIYGSAVNSTDDFRVNMAVEYRVTFDD